MPSRAIMVKPYLLFFLALAIFMLGFSRARMLDGEMKKTELVLFMDNWEFTPNKFAKTPNTYKVGGIPYEEWGILKFGTVYVLDGKVTESYDRDSKEVARAQGIYVNSALDGMDLHVMLSLVFNAGEFNGSTLEIQGADKANMQAPEVSVVSGTGKFRLARGYATLEVVYRDRSNIIMRWNITVYQPNGHF